jgi:hypothetical protein
MLYAGNNAGAFVIGHDGNNDPAINTAARVDPETGNGVVVLETAIGCWRRPWPANGCSGERAMWIS